MQQVLVLDSSATEAARYQHCLAPGGWQVAIVTEPAAVAQAFQQPAIDLPAAVLVVDPIGPAAVAAVLAAAVAAPAAVAVVVIGGESGAATVAEMLRAGVSDYVVADDQLWDKLPQVLEHATTMVRERWAAKRDAAVLAASHDAIIGLDPEGRIRQWNPAAAALYHLTAAAAIGDVFSHLVPAAAQASWQASLQQVLAGRSSGGRWQRQRPDGNIFEVSASLAPLRGDDGEVIGAVLIEQDQTWRRTINDLRRLNDELDQFALIAAHDLHAPLGSVALHLDLALVSLTAPPADPNNQQAPATTALQETMQTIQTLQTAQQTLAGARQMIDALLDYARSGHVAVDADEACSVAPAAEQALKNLGPDCAPAVDIAVDGLPRVWCSPPHLVQIIQNLLQNAFTHAGVDTGTGAGLRVHVEPAQAPQHSVAFAVRDNGPGIPPSAQQRLFSLFHRGQQGGDGLGIGLAVVKKLTEARGGSVRVESAPGQGARFIVTLPDAGDLLPAQQ